jgi:hypothetical protein
MPNPDLSVGTQVVSKASNLIFEIARIDGSDVALKFPGGKLVFDGYTTTEIRKHYVVAGSKPETKVRPGSLLELME